MSQPFVQLLDNGPLAWGLAACGLAQLSKLLIELVVHRRWRPAIKSGFRLQRSYWWLRIRLSGEGRAHSIAGRCRWGDDSDWGCGVVTDVSRKWHEWLSNSFVQLRKLGKLQKRGIQRTRFSGFKNRFSGINFAGIDMIGDRLTEINVTSPTCAREIFNQTETIAGYDNPINRQFAFGPLSSVGLSEPEDGMLNIDTDLDKRRPGLYRIRKQFHVARDLKVLLAGETVLLPSNTNIEMSWSYKYDRDALVDLITSSGMQLIAEHASTDKRFITLLLKK